MRIITGTARGIRLKTLDGEEVTRPTAERVKEAVFSIIQFDIEGRNVLDLFAGSGQIGLELLSRGAAKALFSDANGGAVEIIKRNAQKTKLYERCRILKSDYKDVIRACAGREKFNIIYIDPPYASDYLADALKKLINSDIIADGGIVICESENPELLSCEGLELRKHIKYGRTYITVFDKEVRL